MELFLLLIGAILGAGLVLAISAFKPRPPDTAPKPQMVYDFEYTDDILDLRSALGIINVDGYELIAVTQIGDHYTIIFRRPMPG